MAEIRYEKFDPLAFLAKAGVGRKILHLKAKAVIFSQGDKADAVFYIQSGRAKLTVVSKAGCRTAVKYRNFGVGPGLLHLNRFFRTFGARR
jgi:CRP/FNR family transcriptional regulator, cyclic AMP receptor protein